MIEVGTHIVIPIAGMSDPVRATHEVVGHDPHGYLLICPVGKVKDLRPEQTTPHGWSNPVSRIWPSKVTVKED